MPELTDGQWMILVTSVAGVVTTLVTQWFSWSREKRNREWDLADRAQARQERRAAEQIVVNKIDENTAINQHAIEAANQFNRKVEAITSLFLKDPQRDERGPQ